MMHTTSRRLMFALFALAVLAACRPAPPAQAPAATTDIPKIAFEKYTLPNGLEVILSEDHRLPMVAVNLWYHVGPANEAAGRTGFAHLFEHMMFQGSKHVPPDSHFKILEGAGASDINGTTDFDRTNYFETLPSNQLELALWLESDRMGYLLDVVDQTSLVEPAGRRPQRAPPGRREPALRHRPGGAVPPAVPEGPPVLRERHRLARRHPGRDARRREELLQDCTTRRTTPAWRSSATSTRPRSGSSSRSTSGRSSAGRRFRRST